MEVVHNHLPRLQMNQKKYPNRWEMLDWMKNMFSISFSYYEIPLLYNEVLSVLVLAVSLVGRNE